MADHTPVRDMNMVLRDMADGVMLIRKNGNISYINARGKEILEVGDDAVGTSLAVQFMDESENDTFIQNIMDAVYNSGTTYKQKLPFVNGGKRKMIELSSTYAAELEEMVLVFTDVTEQEKLRKTQHDSMVFISALFALVCLAVLAFELLELAIPGVVSPDVYTIGVELLAGLLSLSVFKLNGYKLSEFNLTTKGFKKNLPLVIGGAVAAAGFMCLIKFLLIKFGFPGFPPDAPFWNTPKLFTVFFYPFRVVYQEILSRCFAQERLKDIFVGKYGTMLSIIISSLIFSVLHVSFGFPMMIGAFLLLSVFGILYEKVHNIWSLCIVHYVAGTVADLLNFM